MNELIPGLGGSKKRQYSNPFFGVAQEYHPINDDQMLWWANHFLFRFGFYRSALARIANYHLTTLNFECDDSAAKDKYKAALDAGSWKQVLSKAGLDLLAYGNVYATVVQGFDRFLMCNNCKRISNIEKLHDYTCTADLKFTATCNGCKKAGEHTVIDKGSKDLDRVNITFWNPRQVEVQYDEVSGSSRYFWMIPPEYVQKVTRPNNKFFSKKVPKVIFESIRAKKAMELNGNNFIHLKVPTPAGIPSRGKAVPYCIYMFDDFFMLKVLERYNQALMLEDIAPFRVFSMMDNAANPQANSVLMQNSTTWKTNVVRMIEEHRKDPAGYHIFPATVNYQQLGANGKALAPTEAIRDHTMAILNALNIPQELYSMTLQAQTAGPALRLFENTWSYLIDIYNKMLQHWADVIGKIKGLPAIKVTLTPISLSDDIERKSIIGQLVASDSIARSELLGMYNFDYREQLRKKQEEKSIQSEMEAEEKTKQDLINMENGVASSPSPGDQIDSAQQIAQQLFPQDGAARRAELQKIKSKDEQMYSMVKQKLEEMTASAQSQGVNQAKQQQ